MYERGKERFTAEHTMTAVSLQTLLPKEQTYTIHPAKKHANNDSLHTKKKKLSCSHNKNRSRHPTHKPSPAPAAPHMQTIGQRALRNEKTERL